MAADPNSDDAPRYRSRVLREMAANRANPLNSPPSSTGSHGTASPTQSSIITDPEGESTRQLNEAIARHTGRKLAINWEATHRKWPDFFSKPDDNEVLPGDAESRPSSQQENKPPALAPTTVRFANETARRDVKSSKMPRATMQPHVDDESDLSSILSASPDQPSSRRRCTGSSKRPGPVSDTFVPVHLPDRVANKTAATRPAKSSRSPERSGQRERHPLSISPSSSSARSSLTAVQASPDAPADHNHDASHAPSFFMPDVSHLGDFITGTLKLSGSCKNGVPILVKHGKVLDRKEMPSSTHATVDGIDVPDDEEKIFVSMDMIRDEVISLQDHFSKVQAYAEDLQQQVRELEARNSKRSPPSSGSHQSDRNHEKLLVERMQLEKEVEALRARLDRTDSSSPADHFSISLERDRAVRRLQSACDDISKLTKKLSLREKELESSHRQLESTDQLRHDHEALRTELKTIKVTNEALSRENASLNADQEVMHRAHGKLQLEVERLRSERKATSRTDDSLTAEIRSLQITVKNLKAQREDLAQSGRHDHRDLCAAEGMAVQLRHQIERLEEEKASFKAEYDRLLRHNDDYVNEIRMLRRENDGLERSIHDLHAEKMKWRVEFDQLKGRLDNCRIIPDVLGPGEEDTEENMTSAVLVPDVTLDTDISGLHDGADSRPPGAHDTASASRNVNNTDNRGPRNTRLQKESGNHHPSNNNNNGDTAQGQKVAFSVPGRTGRGDRAVANQRTKRTSHSLSDKRSDNRATKLPTDRDEDANDTTGLQSVDNTTQALSQSSPAPTTAATSLPMKRERGRDQPSQDPKPQEALRAPRKCPETHIEAVERAVRETCPALSSDARRILDRLGGHDCSNCTVCSRIASHGGVVPPANAAAGKKCVKVPRPVPVTERDIAGEDPTTRPSRPPGHALAIVIKSLDDERRHLEMEMSRLQDRFGSCDKAIAKRERHQLAKQIRAALKLSLAKDDQIYSLYDVLEGQKAAGQAMSEEELEMTVLSITGMTLRDVTGCEDNYTWRPCNV